jgi:hypothetical protein
MNFIGYWLMNFNILIKNIEMLLRNERIKSGMTQKQLVKKSRISE